MTSTSSFVETSMGTSLKDIGRFEQEYRQSVYDMGKIVVNR